MLLKQSLNDARGVDTSNLADGSDFIALKDEIYKLDISKLVNFITSLSSLKAEVDDLDGGKLKTHPVELKIRWCSR